MADDQRTHGENCYLWDRHHYECALRERIEKAPVGEVYETEDMDQRSWFYVQAPRELEGHRVRLVREV